jgi:hypothetical protein
LPRTDSDPTGLLMTKKHLGVTSVVSRHIFYLGDDSHVHELHSDLRGQEWKHRNITKGMADIVKPAPGSTLAAYAFLGQNTLHVVYRGEDDRIHELFGKPGSWKYSPIGQGFTPAKGDPVGYATEWASTQHVVYRGAKDEVVELWWKKGQWRENVLTKTKATSLAPKSKSDVAGYSFESIETQHVVYFSEDGSPRELWWDKGGWHKGAYELENPFPDDMAPLASPFFYESTHRDHTFFVEPYVVETAVHEWTGWVVTTEEYVAPQLYDKEVLVKLIPDAIDIEPSTVSLVKSQIDRYTKTLYGKGAVVRTPKGVIESQINASLAPVRMVDVKKGLQVLDVKTSNNRFGGFQ